MLPRVEQFIYRLQDKPKAIELRDRLRAEGCKVWMTMELGTTRYDGTVTVHSAPLSNRESKTLRQSGV